jgi:hypothetical protein
MLNLTKNARPDERFHLQTGQPVATVWSLFGLLKRVTWSHIFLADGTPGSFTSWWVLGNAIHWYQGNVKCDGSRTQMYWGGQLDDGLPPPYIPLKTKYVMTTTRKEMLSVRFFVDPAQPEWDLMGGA